MPVVVIADTTKGLRTALEDVFAPYGGLETVIPKNGGTSIEVTLGMDHEDCTGRRS